MVITFDPKKDKLNKHKHGVSLAAASELDWDNAVIWTDARYAYTELRECALGLIAYHMYHVSFVDRGDIRRIISLRKASPEEEWRYAGQK